MKKLFLALAFAGFIAACNNNTENPPAEGVDSTQTAPAPAPDSTMHTDSTAVGADTTAH